MSKELIPNEKAIVAGVLKSFNKMESAKKGYVNSVIEFGETLIDAKKKAGFGNWENLCKISFKSSLGGKISSPNQAWKYMEIAENKSLVLEFFKDENSINGLTKAISDATPEQLAQVEQLKKEEEDRIALAETNKALAEAKAAIDNAKKQDDVIDGEFVEVKKPAPVIVERPVEDPLDILQETIDMLEADNAILQTEMASIVKVLDANDQLTAALAEVKKYQELARVLKESLNGSMNSENAAKRQAKMWKAKYEKLAKEVGRE
jgi:hypothetical protein